MTAEAAPVVFLGPSLPLARAREILEACYRPPIRRGDLATLPGGTLVGIIDGVLEDGFRLEPDELAAAAESGLVLYGAASTGALLAVQAQGRGIRGVGRVFDFLRRHPGLETLVEVLYAEPHYATFTLPLINSVLAVERRDPALAPALAHRLSRIPLHERSRERIEKVLRDSGVEDAGLVAAVDCKAEDAVALLQALKRHRQ